MSAIRFDATSMRYGGNVSDTRKKRDVIICQHLNNGVRILVVMEKSADSMVTAAEARSAVVRLLRGNPSKNSIKLYRLMRAMEPKFQLGFANTNWFKGDETGDVGAGTISLERFEQALKEAFGDQFVGIKLLNKMQR